MPRNKGIFTIKATKCRTVVISGTNQLPYSVRGEDTDSLSIGALGDLVGSEARQIGIPFKI